MNLNDYPTPLTDAAIKKHGDEFTGHMARNFARDLERKLALCRDALEKTERRFSIKCKDTCMFREDLDAIKIARETLESTK